MTARIAYLAALTDGSGPASTDRGGRDLLRPRRRLFPPDGLADADLGFEQAIAVRTGGDAVSAHATAGRADWETPDQPGPEDWRRGPGNPSGQGVGDSRSAADAAGDAEYGGAGSVRGSADPPHGSGPAYGSAGSVRGGADSVHSGGLAYGGTGFPRGGAGAAYGVGEPARGGTQPADGGVQPATPGGSAAIPPGQPDRRAAAASAREASGEPSKPAGPDPWETQAHPGTRGQAVRTVGSLEPSRARMTAGLPEHVAHAADDSHGWTAGRSTSASVTDPVRETGPGNSPRMTAGSDRRGSQREALAYPRDAGTATRVSADTGSEPPGGHETPPAHTWYGQHGTGVPDPARQAAARVVAAHATVSGQPGEPPAEPANNRAREPLPAARLPALQETRFPADRRPAGQAAGRAETPTLSIGTIEVTLLAPPADPVPASTFHREPRQPPRRLSRGLGPRFGQGQT